MNQWRINLLEESSIFFDDRRPRDNNKSKLDYLILVGARIVFGLI